MMPILQINLHDEREMAEATNLPRPVRTEPETPEERKKLEAIANRAAHKAAAEFGRYRSSIFSK